MKSLTVFTGIAMNLEKSRFNMIEQQIRTWNVLNQSVLDLLFLVKREQFMPTGLEDMAFTDCELPIRVHGKNTGQFTMSPKLEARLVQELQLAPHEQVLQIGAGTGYLAALLAQKCSRITVTEFNPDVAEFARQNLEKNQITQVKIIQCCGFKSAASLGQFDVIVQAGRSEVIPDMLIQQLKPNGRFIGIIGQDPVHRATLIKKSATQVTSTTPLFETTAFELPNAPKAKAFQF